MSTMSAVVTVVFGCYSAQVLLAMQASGASGDRFLFKSMSFVFKTMSFVVKMMDFVVKMMDFGLKMMIFMQISRRG